MRWGIKFLKQFFWSECWNYIECNSNPVSKAEDIKKLLVEQIEKPVRWRESVSNMIDLINFIEIGPGKILSGLVKRIDRNVKLNQVNNLSDLKKLND